MIASSAPAARSRRASSSSGARSSPWAVSSAPRPRSSTAPPARRSWAGSRPTRWWCRAACRVRSWPMARPARRFIAVSSSSASMSRRAARPRSMNCCATIMSAAATIDPLALAEALIRRPSVTPRDEGALPHLAAVLGALGFACHLQEFSEPGTEPVLNLYARAGTTGRNFCFAGHTDVVPPGARENWTSDPFTPATRDGMLCGRGASDMKTAIACFVAAASQFLGARGSDFAGSISLLVTGDEEGVSINGTRKLLDWVAAQGETLDACIVGEPTNVERLGDTIKIGRRGSLNATLTVHGVQGHTAYPHLADNAAHRLVRMLSALLAEPLDTGTAHFQATSLEISTIDIGNPATT